MDYSNLQNRGAIKKRARPQHRIRASVTGTRNVDDAIHKLNVWLKELMEDMQWDNRERALSAFRATLHALRDILPLETAVHFGAQLPLIFKGIYYDGWAAKKIPVFKVNDVEDFYELIRHKLGPASAKFEDDTIRLFSESVINILAVHMGTDELKKIRSVLRLRARDIIPLRAGPA